MSQFDLENDFLSILNSFTGITKERKFISTENLIWFLRIGAINNMYHKDYAKSIYLAQTLLNKIESTK